MELPEPYASTVLHHYLDGLSTTEIARSTGCASATVRKRLERARAMLRDKLDREFDCDTKSWALALALPFESTRPAALVTGTSASSATTLFATGLMGSKTIGWIGVVLVCLLVGLGGDYFAGAEPGVRAAEIETAALTTTEIIPEEVAEVAVPAETSERISVPEVGTQVASSAPALAEETRGVVLLVRGIDANGDAVSVGQIDCFWSPKARIPGSSKQNHIVANISSAITRVQLPEGAQSARVSVSHRSYPPSAPVELQPLSTKATAGNDPGANEVHVDVQLSPVEDNPDTFAIYGDIYTDDALHCPPGLRIFVNGAGYAWINTLTSQYRFERLNTNETQLLIVSDHCLPTIREIEDLPGDQRLDLKLQSGRELQVYAVDALTGAPAVGREVSIRVFNTVKKTFLQRQTHSHTQTAVVNAAGLCRFQGIPIEGQVQVIQELADGVGTRVLHLIRVNPDDPEVLECEVRLESADTVITRVFGTVPLEAAHDPAAIQQRFAAFTSSHGVAPKGKSCGSRPTDHGPRKCPPTKCGSWKLV
jgi:hypothetical protein